MIRAIFIAAEPQAKQRAVNKIDVIAHQGIVGDRNFGQHRWPGQNVTLIENENIDNFNQHHQQNISPQDTRRNLITKGVRLNQLIDKEFLIGQVKLVGTELCEPCHLFSKTLSSDSVSQQQVLDAFREKAGIRATILSSGSITVDMSIVVT
jgi:MOSC domain-containing protein YiiM